MNVRTPIAKSKDRRSRLHESVRATMPRRMKKKTSSAPLGRAGWISVVTAGVFALVVLSAIVIRFIPVEPAPTFGGRMANGIAAIGTQLHEKDGRGIVVPLFILAIVGIVISIASARARRRTTPPGAVQAVGYGILDSILGLAFEAFNVATSGSGADNRSSSGSSSGMSGGGGSFGGGGASGGW